MKPHFNRLRLACRSLAVTAAIQLPLLSGGETPPPVLDREPVAGENLPCQPGDGEIMRVNPPAFRWLPAGGDEVRYRLQVAAEPDFTRPVYQAENLKWRIEVPTSPLKPGKWYWRYGVELPDGIRWSRVRAFSIAEDAAVFPFPAPGWMERIPATRPRLFVPEGTLSALRRRARQGELKPQADWLVREVHKFAGEKLVAEPPFLGKEPWGALYATIFRTTRPPMDKMERAALAWLLTGDEACAREAKRRLLTFFGWDPKGSTNLFHNDEPAMWMMMRGVRTYDWIYPVCTPEERRSIEAVMLERGRDLFRYLTRRQFDNRPYESHAGRMVGFLGEAALSLAPEYPEAKEWLDYAVRIYYGAYPCWGGEDGGWNEGTHYWVSYMDFILNFVVALRNATGVDLGKKPFFRNTPYYLYYSSPPFIRRQVFGDGYAAIDMKWYGGMMYNFALLNRDPHLKYYAEATGFKPGLSLLNLFAGKDDFPAEPPSELSGSRLFADVGLAALRNTLTDGENHIGMKFRSSPFGAVSHGHRDQNTFAIEAFGEPLAIATGYYNYYASPHHSNYTRSTRAKCGITYDGGKGQVNGWKATGKITLFEDTPGYTLLSAEAAPAYGGALTRAERQIIFLKQAGVFVIHDLLAAPEAHAFEYWLHALDEMKIDEARQVVTITRPKAVLSTHFLLPASPRFRQTTQFDPPVGEQKRAYMVDNYHLAAAAAPAKEAVFLTVLAVTKPGAAQPQSELLESPTARGAVITLPDGRRFLAGFAREGAKAPFRLDAVQSTTPVFTRELPRLSRK